MYYFDLNTNILSNRELAVLNGEVAYIYMEDTYMELFYTKPAEHWEETLPLGNGSIGAMIWGSQDERIGLNEESLWSGYYHDKNNDKALSSLEKVRKLIFDGNYIDAQEQIEASMFGEFTESYLPLGDIIIKLNHQEKITQYERRLSLDTAISSIGYQCQTTKFNREYFVSQQAKALIVKLSASKSNMKAVISFETQLKASIKRQENLIEVQGKCPEHIDPNYVTTEKPIIWGDKGQKFRCKIVILDTDGTYENHAVVENDDRIDCNNITIKDSSYIIFAFSAVNLTDIEAIYKEFGYDGLKNQHIEEYKSYYDRVKLYLGTQPNIPTDERLSNLRKGKDDESLYALYFQYGRYLLISSSRNCVTPANLQGIWNWHLQAPWSSNYTTNINLQMNYWLAHSCNLFECMDTYFDFLKKICEEGKKTARIHFNCRGFSLSHNTDYWGNTNPVGVANGRLEGIKGSGTYAFFPMGGAWLCQELWSHYEYTNDLEFLKNTAYPILEQAALFCNDWLVEHNGYYVTCPSTSPENKFVVNENQSCSIAYASTIDLTIIREVFDNFRKTCETLHMEHQLIEEINKKEEKLFPFKIGQYGQLQEWFEDFEEAEPGHRHISHLYGMFPSELFANDENLKKACRKSLERRLANGGGHTGWSCGWIICMWAVFGEGDKAYEFLNTLLTRSSYNNLWDAHPPFQIDGNFAGSAAIANMLVQDRGGKLRILPALPTKWKNGYVKGLRIKDGKTIDISWKNGKLEDYEIY